jgi:hypothetical protein
VQKAAYVVMHCWLIRQIRLDRVCQLVLAWDWLFNCLADVTERSAELLAVKFWLASSVSCLPLMCCAAAFASHGALPATAFAEVR